MPQVAARGISVILASGDSGSGWSDTPPPPPASCNALQRGTEFHGTNATTLKASNFNTCCQAANDGGFHGWTYTKGWFNEHSCTGYSSVTGKSNNKQCVSGAVPNPEPSSKHMWPSWPASSPWVTSVGATMFGSNDPAQPEVASEQFGSGGGFSYVTARAARMRL